MIKTKINKDLLPVKAHYFLFNAGTAPVVPFMSTYSKQLGFSSFVTGIIYAILPIAGMLAKPIMGLIADKFHAQKSIFLVMQLIVAIAFIGINYIPEIDVDAKIKFSCDNSEAVLDTCINKSTALDRAIINKLNTLGTVYCDLNCYMENGYWETVCNYWNASQYCNDESKRSDSLKFGVYVDMGKMDMLEDCLLFKINDAALNGHRHYPNCPDSKHHISSICSVTCNLSQVNEVIASSTVSDEDVTHVYQFWLFLILMVIGWVAQAVVVSVGDTICFELLGDHPERYGQQRMYGALGWGVFAIIAGAMVDAFSEGKPKKDYLSVFYLAFAMLIMDCIVSYTIKYSQKKTSPGIVKDVAKLLTNMKIIVFMLWCVCVGLCTALMWNFLFWLVEELAEKQGPDTFASVKTLEGVIMAIQCLLGELPFFFLSGWILKRIGHINAMTLVLLVFGVRLILYSVIKNPWWFLPIELSSGLTFGLFYACMASYASIISPPGTETTVQGMVGAVFEGVGVSLGSLIAGSAFDKYGGPTTFKAFGIGCLIACLLHALVQYLLVQRHSDTGKARYANPKEAIDMIAEDDQQELKLVGT